MPYCLYHATCTPIAIGATVDGPQDQDASSHPLIDALGGRLLRPFFAFGKDDHGGRETVWRALPAGDGTNAGLRRETAVTGARSLRGAALVAAAALLSAHAALGAVTSEDRDGSSALVPFASEEGLARLARSESRVDFPTLANQFEPQYNGAFCGPASAAIVLNTVYSRSEDLPRDHTRLREEDLRFLPPGADPTVPRFTQDSVIDRGAKTRAQVLGEEVEIGGKSVRDFGYQLRQFDELLRANGLATKLVVVSDTLPEAVVRSDLIDNLVGRDDYVIVNYLRRAVGQEGSGHISPLGAYDALSDSFLVLDVNPAAAGWIWMPASTLIDGMRTFDTLENRGYVLVHAP